MPIRLLRLIHSFNPSGGGPVEGILQISPHLSELGVSTSVLSLDPPNAPFLADVKGLVTGLGPAFSGYGYRRDLSDTISYYARKHDVAIIHGLWQYHAIAGRRAFLKSNIPYYVYPHGMLDPWFNLNQPIKSLKKRLYWKLGDYRVLRDAGGVLFTSQRECTLARHSFSPYHVNELVVGYGTSRPPVRNSHSQNPFLVNYPHLFNSRIILFLGRIHPKKGIDLLMRAFATICACDPNLHLVIAGPDQVGLQLVLQKLALQLDIASRITWTGMLSGELKWGALHSAELFCLPSHQENFGIAVAEALACGLPVMISSSINISDDVASANAGLVHSPTQHGTTSAFHRWLTISQHERYLIGVNAQSLFESKYNFSSIASKLLPILNSARN